MTAESRSDHVTTYCAQVGSVFKTLGFPTTISRALARVTATLNLWRSKECVRVMFCMYVHRVCACICGRYLLILYKTQAELFVNLCVVGAAPNCRHQDDSPLLTLELLHRPNLTNTYINLTHSLFCVFCVVLV